MNHKLSLFCLISILLTGCSGTTVVLVPDPSGKVGEVNVSNSGGSTTLNKANESAEAEKNNVPPSQPVILSDSQIQEKFGDTLKKEPIPPERRPLYFDSGSADLNQPAFDELNKTIAIIQKRKSCDLSIIGHSDRIGTNASNKGISLQRAENVANALTAKGVDKKCMDVRYYGENDPAVPTPDEVAEPRNRRVEIEIR